MAEFRSDSDEDFEDFFPEMQGYDGNFHLPDEVVIAYEMAVMHARQNGEAAVVVAPPLSMADVVDGRPRPEAAAAAAAAPAEGEQRQPREERNGPHDQRRAFFRVMRAMRPRPWMAVGGRHPAMGEFRVVERLGDMLPRRLLPRQTDQSSDHNCQYCRPKQRKLESTPALNFRPTALRQQILLYLGYKLFHKTGARVSDLPLPESLLMEVKRVSEELERWLSDNKHFDESVRHGNASVYRCFVNDVHWLPGTTVIDRRATARMIIQCNVGVHRANEFLLAATNCLADEAQRLWPLVDGRTRELWMSSEPFSHNPILMYFVGKCGGPHNRTAWALERVTSYCIRQHNFDTLTYFWPLVVEHTGGLGGEKMNYLLDHSFHEAVEVGNRAAVYFLWQNALIENHRSMISAAHCCGTRNAYYAFEKAVIGGYYDIAQFMWSKTSPEQHNGMLLAEHANAFCTAASAGFLDVTRLLWRETTNNQRFVLLFERSCAAFRNACANGHVDVVRLLWEDASTVQRRQVLAILDNEALTSACRNGRVNVVQFLWENMDEELKSFLTDTILSKCIREAASSNDGGPVLRFFFRATSSPTTAAPSKAQLMRGLLANNACALKKLLERGEENDEFAAELQYLFDIFECDERRLLAKNATPRQAAQCGLSPGCAPTTSCIPKSSSVDESASTSGVEMAVV